MIFTANDMFVPERAMARIAERQEDHKSCQYTATGRREDHLERAKSSAIQCPEKGRHWKEKGHISKNDEKKVERRAKKKIKEKIGMGRKPQTGKVESQGDLKY